MTGMPHILDGQALAQTLRAQLQQAIEQRSRAPGLAVIQVGEDPASSIYVRNKEPLVPLLVFTPSSATFRRMSLKKHCKLVSKRTTQIRASTVFYCKHHCQHTCALAH